MSPTEPLEGYVENYFLLVGDKNVVNFTKLLELKGIRKPDQGPLLDMFHKRISHHDNLVENSNLLPLEVLQQSANGSNLTGGGTIPSSITTSLSTMASTAASNFNNTSSSFRTNANSPNTTSPTSFSSPTEGTRGRLNENFRKLVMTGMAFRKDLQERRDHQS
jgi:hypothetical protein